MFQYQHYHSLCQEKTEYVPIHDILLHAVAFCSVQASTLSFLHQTHNPLCSQTHRTVMMTVHISHSGLRPIFEQEVKMWTTFPSAQVVLLLASLLQRRLECSSCSSESQRPATQYIWSRMEMWQQIEMVPCCYKYNRQKVSVPNRRSAWILSHFLVFYSENYPDVMLLFLCVELQRSSYRNGPNMDHVEFRWRSDVLKDKRL